MRLPMSADRPARGRALVVAAALTAFFAVAAPVPAAHAGSAWCALGGVLPFGDVVCNKVVSGAGAAAKAISFAEDPLGYLQQHTTAASDGMLGSLLSQTSSG